MWLSLHTIRGFPSSTFVGILDAINQLGFEYRFMTRFVCMDKADAEVEIIKLQKYHEQQAYSVGGLMKEVLMGETPKPRNPAAAIKSDETKAALAELANDTAAFGLCTATVVTWHSDPIRAREQGSALKKLIESRGFIVVDEAHNSLEAFLGSLPGHVPANVRRPMIHTQNLAHMMPLSAMWTGDPVNKHLLKVSGVGHPHIFATSGGSPFALNFNPDDSDAGMPFIVGPRGSGKSTLGAHAANLWNKYTGGRIIIYDYGGSARASTLAHMSVPGYAQYFAPGNAKAPLMIQPLRQIHDAAERVWAAEFVRLLLSLQGGVLTVEVQEKVDAALDKVAGHGHPAALRLGHYAKMLGTFDKRLGAALRPYTSEGIYGHIFDAGVLSAEQDRYAPWRMYEMYDLMALGEAAVVPALKYLDRCDRATYDGSPVLKLYDECWRFMGHPTFAGMLREDLKTLRKRNVFIAFMTQELADAAARPELLSSILSACSMLILGADPNALAPEAAKAYAAFGLSQHEIALISSMQPKREYYHRAGQRKRVFSLNLGPAALALAGASSVQDHKDMDALVAQYEPREYAVRLFERRGVTWAARVAREAAQAAWDALPAVQSDEAVARVEPASVGGVGVGA
jgi:type IV secretion system protein VirB4